MANAEEILRKLLKKIAAEQKYENTEIIVNKISSGGANYTSKLFTVIIREENKDDLHLFGKVATAGEAFRKDMPVDLYKNEVFAYTKLAKTYASLEEENGVPEEHRLYFTKLYGYDPTIYQETLVLENLLAHGYGPHNRFQSVTWEYASSAVADLAKMHALSFALAKQYPEEFEKVFTDLKFEWEEYGSMYDMLQKMTSVALENVEPKYRDTLEKFMKTQKSPFTMYAPIRSTVIVHGDFRGDNLLHRVREDGKVEIKIVDLQGLHPGSPVADLIYFIFTGSDEEFRSKYYEKLVDHYYTQLSAAMKRLHLDPEETFSREDFEYEIKELHLVRLKADPNTVGKSQADDDEATYDMGEVFLQEIGARLCAAVQKEEKLPFGLTLSVFSLPLLTMDSQDTPEVNEALEMSSFEVKKTSELYVKRLNGVVTEYVKWGILK